MMGVNVSFTGIAAAPSFLAKNFLKTPNIPMCCFLKMFLVSFLVLIKTGKTAKDQMRTSHAVLK
jgi:hypothetical protein